MRDPFGKLLALVGGAALVAIFGTLGVEAWQDYRAFGDTPTPSTLVTAIDASTRGRRWVSVEGAPWRCEQLVRNVRGGAAFLPASAEDGATVVARFDRPIACQAVVAQPLEGIIEPMTAERAADLRAAGLALTSGGRLRTLSVCTSCGRENARLGVIMCAALVLLGLGLYPLRRAYQLVRGNVAHSLQAAIHAQPEQAAVADRTVRNHGALLLVVGVAAFAWGEGYVIYEVVSLRWAGLAVVLLGAWMVSSPGTYRRLAARGERH